MKRNNYIIFAAAFAVSIFLLWLWYALQFNLVDAPTDLIICVIWWVLIAVCCFIIYRVEMRRQKRLRTCYLAEDGLFNAEAGSKSYEDMDSAVECLEDVLENLEYGFDFQELPEDGRFIAVVRSDTFTLKQAQDAEGRPSRQIEEWTGEVAVVAKPSAQPLPFSNGRELGEIISSLKPAV